MTAPRDRYLQQIARDPDSEQAYEVYADLLQHQGDPRGELIALMLRGAERAAQEHLRAYEDAFFGAVAYYRKKVRLTWRYGFIAHAQIRLDPDHGALVMDALMTEESARFLRGVRLLDLELDARCAALEILCRAPRPFLRSLSVSGSLLMWRPDKGSQTAQVAPPKSKAYTRHLDRAFDPILKGKNLPVLRSLSLVRVDAADTILYLLCRAPLMLQLESLNLSHCPLTDSAVESLALAAMRAEQLQRLTLDEESLELLSAKAQTKLKQLAQQVGWKLEYGGTIVD